MDNIHKQAERAVRNAGNIFFDRELHKMHIKKTGDQNFATKIDFAVQEYLIKELERIIPGSNIISEESSKNQYIFDKPTWIMDPVDGTTNIMHQYQHSAISLALVIDGKLNMGVVFNPYMDEMFLGTAGNGAYLNDERIEVSKAAALKDSLIGFGTTPYDRSTADTTFKIVRNVFVKSQEIRRSGSAALDIVYVACGRLDGFFELQLQTWDYAAGVIILEEAGGRITNWSSQKPSLLHPDSILATNGLVHNDLLHMLI